MVRHTICQQVLSMLHHTPSHITDLTASPGWESLFLWLLTPFDHRSESRCDTPGAESSDAPSDDELRSSTTYVALNTVKTDGLPSGCVESVSSGGVEGVTSGSVEGVSSDNELSEDDRQYPIVPDLTVPEASGGVTNVEGAGKRKPHKRRPLSMPPTTTLNTTSEGQGSLRSRTNAFLDSATGERSSSGEFMKRHSVTYSRSWKLSEVESEEVKRTFSVVTETIAYLLWHSVDYERDHPPWKVNMMSYDVTDMSYDVI